MKSKYIIYSCSLAMALFTGACSNDDPSPIPAGQEMNVNSIYVASENIKYAPGISRKENDNSGEESNSDDPFTNVSVPFILSELKEGSMLYFSQKGAGASRNPDFINNQTEGATPYVYKYQYNPNSTATWEDGYNFKNVSPGLAFDWANTLDIGPDGNIFKFFAFHYPVDNNVRWNVETDQTGGTGNQYDTSNFLRSDILGAYHATSSIFTRMRFRLFHLMTYLQVTVYVPTFNGTVNDYDDMSYSGFLEGALQGGYMLGACTNFEIDWTAARSSDTDAPLIQVNENQPKQNIKMYLHEPNEEQTFQLPIKNYYNGSVDGVETDYIDEVRAYTFSVIFPTQSFGDNFLCFALTTPGNEKKYYYFSSSQILPAEDGSSSFGLTQGTLQQLFLYLPRKNNQTILIGAKILPWQEAVTDMTVNKQNNGN